jgi:hypothetical protein
VYDWLGVLLRRYPGGGGQQRSPALSLEWKAHCRAEASSRRPKPAELAHAPLVRQVSTWLGPLWPPQGIAQRLLLEFPDDPMMQTSHENIYQSLFAQGRGELGRELARCRARVAPPGVTRPDREAKQEPERESRSCLTSSLAPSSGSRARAGRPRGLPPWRRASLSTSAIPLALATRIERGHERTAPPTHAQEYRPVTEQCRRFGPNTTKSQRASSQDTRIHETIREFAMFVALPPLKRQPFLAPTDARPRDQIRQIPSVCWWTAAPP